MKFPLKERALSAAIIAPTAAAVLALAVLQYRWSNDAREATGVRLADALQLSMVNWHLDLFRTFWEVCLTVRMDAEGKASSDLNLFIRQFAQWKTVARYPDLVAGIYLLDHEAAAGGGVRKLDSSGRRFEPALLPATMARLPNELRQVPDDLLDDTPVSSPGQPFAESFYNIGEALRGWRFDPDIPALVHPIARDSEPVDYPLPIEPGATAWIVIAFNEDVVRSRVLPDLAHRYFQGTDGLDYDVAVVARPPREVIYSSELRFGDDDVSDADGRMDVFGRREDGNGASPIFVFHRTSENRGPTAAVGIEWFPLLRESSESERWELIVRHRRGGPLGAFVAGMYRRDLAISFGGLLLLVISMGMLIITANRAQRLAKLQMDFVTAVSHELRTPLTVIGSAADNIAHGVVEGKEQMKQYGSAIDNQVKQLSGLVEQVLLFASMQKGRPRYASQPLRVTEITDAALSGTREMIHAAGFTIECDIPADLPRVSGDLPALSQCLQNLITNALKYGGESRWIQLRAGVALNGNGRKEIQISVADHGIGIDEDDLAHIFDPFYRSPSVASAQIHGTGLGLTLAKGAAEAMKGDLTVRSTLGQGSTFVLHLPCLDEPDVLRNSA